MANVTGDPPLPGDDLRSATTHAKFTPQQSEAIGSAYDLLRNIAGRHKGDDMTDERRQQLQAWMDNARRAYGFHDWSELGTITREDAIYLLNALVPHSPGEEEHEMADEILLKLINDLDVSAAYHKIDKWYA